MLHVTPLQKELTLFLIDIKTKTRKLVFMDIHGPLIVILKFYNNYLLNYT